MMEQLGAGGSTAILYHSKFLTNVLLTSLLYALPMVEHFSFLLTIQPASEQPMEN